MPGYVERKDKNQILKELIDTAEPGSRAHEQQKTGILLRCTEDLERAPRSLEKSMNNSVNAAGKLATKICWLKRYPCDRDGGRHSRRRRPTLPSEVSPW